MYTCTIFIFLLQNKATIISDAWWQVASSNSRDSITLICLSRDLKPNIFKIQQGRHTCSPFAGLNLAGLNNMKLSVRATRTGFGGTAFNFMFDSMATSSTLSRYNCFSSASNLCIRRSDSCQLHHINQRIKLDSSQRSPNPRRGLPKWLTYLDLVSVVV